MLCFANSFLSPSIPAPLKNAIDWASRPPNVWADKAAAIVSAGGGFGGGRSQYHLRQIGVYLDLHFINKPEFFLNAFQPPAKFDGNGNLVDESFQEKLKEVLISLQAFTLRLQGKLWEIICDYLVKNNVWFGMYYVGITTCPILNAKIVTLYGFFFFFVLKLEIRYQLPFFFFRHVKCYGFCKMFVLARFLFMLFMAWWWKVSASGPCTKWYSLVNMMKVKSWVQSV